LNLEELDKQFVLQTYARDYTNFVRGENATLSPEDGRDFIDFASGIGVSSVGHGNRRLSDAVCEQVRNIIHISHLQVIEPQANVGSEDL